MSEQKNADVKKRKKDFFSFKEIAIIIVGICIIFLILIILPNILNYSESEQDKYSYNGFNFVKLTDPRTSRLFWYTEIQIDDNIYSVPMHYGPRELENITITTINPTEKKNYSNTLYLTIEPRNESRSYLGIAIAELKEKFIIIKSYDLQAACTSNMSESCAGRPVIDCDNDKDIVIKIIDNETQTGIFIDNNCFIIQGMNESLVKATDKLIYKFLRVI